MLTSQDNIAACVADLIENADLLRKGLSQVEDDEKTQQDVTRTVVDNMEVDSSDDDDTEIDEMLTAPLDTRPRRQRTSSRAGFEPRPAKRRRLGPRKRRG